MIAVNLIEAICAALTEKKELFSQYASCTEQLLQCDAESIEHYITKREVLANAIDKIDERIESFCTEARDTEQLHAALRNSCEYITLAPELRCVFTLAQEVHGSMEQTRQIEPAICTRMETLREEARAQIAGMRNTPKITRYLKGMQIGETEIGKLSPRYEKA